MKSSLAIILRFPGVIWLCLILSVIIYFPSLDSGFQADDYHIVAMQKGSPPFPEKAWNLFDVQVFGLTQPGVALELIQKGVIPWWSSPNLKIKTFRPLSGFLLSLDYHLFGESPWPYHLHSLFWGVLLFFSFGLLLRQVLPDRIGAVALIIYTLSTIPSIPIIWILNRYSLLACVFATLGLMAHVRWREQGWKPGRPLSILGVIVSLAGGEIALSLLAFFFAYELAATPDGYRQRLKALSPTIILVIGYLVVYVAFGCGASGSGIYFD